MFSGMSSRSFKRFLSILTHEIGGSQRSLYHLIDLSDICLNQNQILLKQLPVTLPDVPDVEINLQIATIILMWQLQLVHLTERGTALAI